MGKGKKRRQLIKFNQKSTITMIPTIAPRKKKSRGKDIDRWGAIVGIRGGGSVADAFVELLHWKRRKDPMESRILEKEERVIVGLN